MEFYRKKLQIKKVLVILGATATGKSGLAVKLAKKYNGEIVSADSRQVYKGLNIGTGKITKREMMGIPHYMLDVISSKKVFSVSDWQKQAQVIVADILSRGKLPILCGGTGFYIQSIVDNIILPEVPPNKILRKKLEKKTLLQLNTILKKLDKKRYENIDTKNPTRLIRAIEIATHLGAVPILRQAQGKNPNEFLQIGLTLSDDELRKKINHRLRARMRSGMAEEAENLHTSGLSWKRMRQLGLEYRYIADYLEKKLTKTELIQKLETEIWRYAKRQKTWFKRDKRIKWFRPNQLKSIEEEVNKLTQ